MKSSMPFNTLEAVFYALVFLVPGFVWDWTLSVVVPRRAQQHEKLWLLRLLTLSSINFGLWIWLITMIPSSSFFIAHPVRTGLAWAVVVFVSPSVLGLVFGGGSMRKNGTPAGNDSGRIGCLGEGDRDERPEATARRLSASSPSVLGTG